MVFFYKWKNQNEIQLTINKMDLNNRKMKNHPRPPENYINNCWRFSLYKHLYAEPTAEQTKRAYNLLLKRALTNRLQTKTI